MEMRRIKVVSCLLIISLSVFLIACGSKSPAVKTSAAPTTAPTTAPTEAELFLEVTSPVNESVLNSQQTEVTGKTLSTAIVSVNNDLITVKSDGTFSAKVTLQQGSNLIEVVASDVGGNETSQMIMVVYWPQ